MGSGLARYPAGMTGWHGWAVVRLERSISVEEADKVEGFTRRELREMDGVDVVDVSVAQLQDEFGRAVRVQVHLASRPEDPEEYLMQAIHRGLLNAEREMPELESWGEQSEPVAGPSTEGS